MHRPIQEIGGSETHRSNPVTVLELGAATFTSRGEEGRFYERNPDARFVALDLPTEFLVEIPGDEDETNYVRLPGARDERVHHVADNMHAIPLRDESVDVALMRNMFGQFVSPGARSNIGDVRTWGMLELGRVLKPGGRLYVFEENKPWYKGYIERDARKVGLEVASTLYKNRDQSAELRWDKIRAEFYDPRTDIHYTGGKDWQKCIIIQKPADPTYQLQEHEVVINSHRIADWRIGYANNKATLEDRPEQEVRPLKFKFLSPQ